MPTPQDEIVRLKAEVDRLTKIVEGRGRPSGLGLSLEEALIVHYNSTLDGLRAKSK